MLKRLLVGQLTMHFAFRNIQGRLTRWDLAMYVYSSATTMKRSKCTVYPVYNASRHLVFLQQSTTVHSQLCISIVISWIQKSIVHIQYNTKYTLNRSFFNFCRSVCFARWKAPLCCWRLESSIFVRYHAEWILSAHHNLDR